MGRWAITALTLLLATPVGAQEATEPPGHGPAARAISEGLAKLGLTLDTGRVDPRHGMLWGQDAYKLGTYDFIQSDLILAMEWMRHTGRGQVGAGSSSLRDVLAQASRLGDGHVYRGWLFDPYEELAARLEDDPHGALANLLRELLEAGAEEPPEVEFLRATVGDWPEPVARAVARLVAGVLSADGFLELAFLPLEEHETEALLSDAARSWLDRDEGTGSPTTDAIAWRALGQVDRNSLWAGAQDLALAVDAAMADLADLQAELGETVRIATPKGDIVVAGEGPDKHDSPALILIDLGGDDRYSVAGSASPDRPFSIAIDVAGNDTYETDDPLSFGAGLAGYGFLCDMAGADRYRGGAGSQGAGICGMGVLLDAAGDDSYELDRFGQGAAMLGCGALVDRAGDDRYYCFREAQAFASTYGVGLLTDVAGTDEYIADDEDIRNPSPQTPEHNASMAQGAASGARRDYSTGHSAAGGYACLADGGGDDTYSAGLFAHGVGYWYGIGFLADLAGDDSYQGVWYNQASAAHFAIGLLWDAAGDDRYSASHNMAIGAGHDFSLGILLEDGGDDEYHAPNLSLGGGNANGMGLFVDHGGADVYAVERATTLGRANHASRGSVRDLLLSLGVFIDLGGDEDQYPESHSFARNNSLWTQAGTNTEQPADTECGVGIDR